MYSKINTSTSIFFLLLVAQSSFAQNDYKRLLKHSYEEIDRLVEIEYDKGNYDKAIPLIQAGREKAEREFGQQDSIFVEYTSSLGFFYDEMGEYGKALPLYLQAKNIKEKTLGKEHPDFASSLNNLAGLYLRMGNYERALPLYLQCIKIDEKTLGKEHPDFATALNNLAALHLRMGNYELALPLYLEAKNVREKTLGKEHPFFTSSLNNLAYLHVSMGNYELALPFYLEAKNIRAKTLGKEHPDFALSLNSLAVLYLKIGNYELALPLFLQAKNIKEKTLGTEHPSFALSLNNLASLHERMGNYNLALPLYLEAKDIREKKLGQEHPDFATALNNLAFLHEKMGNDELALPLLLQSKKIIEKTLGKEHPDFATALNNLASLHEKMGNDELAPPLYLEAKNIRGKALGTGHPDFAQSLNNLVQLHMNTGNYPKAWNLLGLTINHLYKLELEHGFNQNWMDSLKAVELPSNRHIDELLKALEMAYQLLEKDTRIVSPNLKQKNIADLALFLLHQQRNQTSNEKDKLRRLSQSNDWLQKSLKVLSPEEHTAKAFHLSDQNKSVLLLQATKSEAAYRLGQLPDSLMVQDKKMLKKQSQIQAKLLEKRPKTEKDSLRNELNHVNHQMEDFVSMIKKEYPKYHTLKYQQVDAKLADIQALLDDKTALLEYVIGDSVVHIFWVDKREVIWQKSFVKNEKLSTQIKALHQSLSDYELVTKEKEEAYQKYTTKAYWFYQLLIEPVLKDKQNIQNLIIVSDGALGHLPFETFLVEQAPQSLTDYRDLHYLVHDFNISYNYSATLWKENKEASKPQNNGQILAMAANYKLQLDSSMMEVRLPTDQWLRAALSPLPAARKEVETLQERYEGFFAFDTLASEKVVKKNAANYAILHFATHGILEAKRPVLSSLAFSEDNDSTESNFWQAHEISKIQLNADLVVLSACETGFGKFETGNGIASLARAFMYAGAPALIVSLWQVNDYATSEIMKNLYENLANAMNKDEALRQAKLTYMQSAKGVLAHPAFWSPFIMMGKTDPVSIKRKGNTNTMAWGIGVGFCCLLLLYIVQNRRHSKKL